MFQNLYKIDDLIITLSPVMIIAQVFFLASFEDVVLILKFLGSRKEKLLLPNLLQSTERQLKLLISYYIKKCIIANILRNERILFFLLEYNATDGG